MKKTLTTIFGNKLIGILIVLWLFGLSVVYASTTWYRVNNWVSNLKAYLNGGSTYKVVTNTSWQNLFVPTKTTNEFNRFCDNKTWTSCYSCTFWNWVNNWGRSNTIDHDTGAGSVWHSQTYCWNWCRNILDGVKDTGQHFCVRRSNGRCHLYRDDVLAWGFESWRSYRVLTCNNQS